MNWFERDMIRRIVKKISNQEDYEQEITKLFDAIIVEVKKDFVDDFFLSECFQDAIDKHL